MTKAQRLMAKGVNSRDVGNPQVRRIIANYERENYKAQVAEAQALYEQKLAQGFTPAQAATSQSLPVPQPRNYTVSDGDTITSISQQLNTTPDALLAANPQVKKLQTGLVINTGMQPWNPNYQWGPNYNPTWLDRILGTNSMPRGNPTPIYANSLGTWLGFYGDSGRQWWERKTP